MNLLIISLAPVIAIVMFVYYRDKYEKEPFKMLVIAFAVGILAVLPILVIETILTKEAGSQFVSKYQSAAYDAFVVAGFTEEFFKFLAFIIVIWTNKNFNEKFDGIIYAVMISLGFATFENILYVFQGGMSVGLLRAFTAVPLHAICGVSMGIFLGLAKFSNKNTLSLIFLALVVPILIHGLYDFMIMSKDVILLVLFIPYVIALIIFAVKKIKTQSEDSVFKPIQETNNIDEL
jgi:RsiW-degrading membrane proteinase PrsW (M82 family)